MRKMKFHPDDFLRIRKEKNLTQKQLAKLSGLSVTSIKNFEQGKTVPKYETVVKLCHGLSTDVCNVFYDDEEAKQWERLCALKRMVEDKTKEQLQKAVDSMTKRLREQETVIESKDAMLEVLTVENGKLKERIQELEPKNPWAEVEE